MRSETRKYIRHTHGATLLSWIQNRCIICGKFLGLHGRKYCTRCSIQGKKEDMKRYMKNHKYLRNLRQRVYNNANRYNIGDIL